jgi:hypothetical protein
MRLVLWREMPSPNQVVEKLWVLKLGAFVSARALKPATRVTGFRKAIARP